MGYTVQCYLQFWKLLCDCGPLYADSMSKVKTFMKRAASRKYLTQSPLMLQAAINCICRDSKQAAQQAAQAGNLNKLNNFPGGFRLGVEKVTVDFLRQAILAELRGYKPPRVCRRCSPAALINRT